MQRDAALRCASCGAENAPIARFCNQCSAALTGAPPTAAVAERKQALRHSHIRQPAVQSEFILGERSLP